jgi:hypothetical protein
MRYRWISSRNTRSLLRAKKCESKNEKATRQLGGLFFKGE